MSLIGNMATAGNSQNYTQDLQARQQAEQLANAINALKLQQGQTEAAGSGIAGNAFLSALTQPQGGGMPQAMPGQPPMGAGPPVNVPMPGATPMPSPGGMPGRGMTSLAPAAGPVTGAASATPPMPGAGGAAPGGQAPIGMGSQGLTWKAIATAIKNQNPNAKGPEVMAAIDKLTPVMSAQNKSEWEMFKIQLNNQQKEAALDQRGRLADQRDATNRRGQDMLNSYRQTLASLRLPASDQVNSRRYLSEFTEAQKNLDVLISKDADPKTLAKAQARLENAQTKLDQFVDSKATGGAASANPAISGSPAPETAPQTATGPNGEKVILQNGQWVPMKGP